MMSALHGDGCPKCAVGWIDENNMYDTYRAQGESKAEATKFASFYGCTKTNPLSFSKNVMAYETDDYDGVSFWKCTNCNTLFDRFTMKETQL